MICDGVELNCPEFEYSEFENPSSELEECEMSPCLSKGESLCRTIARIRDSCMERSAVLQSIGYEDVAVVEGITALCSNILYACDCILANISSSSLEEVLPGTEKLVSSLQNVCMLVQNVQEAHNADFIPIDELCQELSVENGLNISDACIDKVPTSFESSSGSS